MTSKPLPAPSPEGDFASAAMVRVLHQGLRLLGLPPPPGSGAVPGARVAIADKRALLQHAVQAGGMACLARLGQGLHHYVDEPMHLALSGARDARDLFERWGRLERYIHSRHRVQVVDIGPRQARLRHVSLRADAPPQPAEDLVVLGVLVAFLQACGHEGVVAQAGGATVWPGNEPQALTQVMANGHSGEWTLHWSSHAGASGSPPRPGGWPEADLLNPPDLNTLARQAGKARRTLQRELQRQGTSFRAQLGEARYHAAGRWLIRHDAALAEVGFLCGYADQSHFTREFRRRSGLTPAEYRRNFRTP